MAKKRKSNYTTNEICVAVFVLLGGIGLTVMSFCIYYLVKPRNTGALIAICAADFAYALFQLCILLKHTDAEKWLLKAILLAIGYIALFIVVAVLFMLFNGAVDFLRNNIVGIVYYAFFTAPCLFIVIAVLVLMLAYGG